MSHPAASLTDGGIGFVGAGSVGTALALALSQRGYAVRAVASRTRASALRLAERAPGIEACDDPQDVLDRCAMVFITVPDGAIAEGRSVADVATCTSRSPLLGSDLPRQPQRPSVARRAGGRIPPVADLPHTGERSA